MNYVQINHVIEPHPECILLLYLQDEQGMPVPNAKIKLWAGPPPTGYPSYFEDNDPNRRTDANGCCQFIVANAAPANPLDFYAQVLGADNAPSSEQFHFPFPAQQAQWVIITAAPLDTTNDNASAPSLEIQPTPPPTPEPAQPKTNTEATVPQVLAKPTKLFTHYLLFGTTTLPGTLTNHILALDYIMRYAPLVGFLPNDAKNAQHVTIVGDTNAVSASDEQALRDAGCLVVRLTASDSYALENIFKQLVASGSPYP